MAHTYQLRLNRISDGNSPAGQLETATHGSGGIERFWTEHTLTTPSEPITVAAANNAAAWLVAGERLSVCTRHEFRRVVMIEASESAELGADSPTWTLIRPLEVGTNGGTTAPANPRGLRSVHRSTNPVPQFLDDHAMLQLAQNRRKGSAWLGYLPGSVAPDDVLGAPQARASIKSAGYSLSLNPSGTAAAFCAPWLFWTWAQVPELDRAVNVSRTGKLTRVSTGTSGEPLLADVTVFNKMRRWQIQKSPALRYLDTLLATIDTKMQAALRAHGSGDYGPAFDLQVAKRAPGELLFLELGYYWREFAALLGFTATGFREFMPTGYDWNTRYLYSDLSYQPSPYTAYFHDPGDDGLAWPNLPPVQVPGVLPVTKNRAQLLELVRQLAACTEWFHDKKDTRRGAAFPLQWRDWRTMPAPLYGEMSEGGGGGLVDIKTGYPEPVPPPGQIVKLYAFTDGAKTNPIWHIVSPSSVLGDTHSSWQRQWAQAEWSRWEEAEDWAFSIVNALNLIELLIYPEHGRRYITSKKDLAMPVPRVPRVPDPAVDSLPASVELLPYIMHHRTTRGPWIRQPGTIVPPNVVTIQTPPPAPPSSVTLTPVKPYTSEYTAQWQAARLFGQQQAQGWVERFPARGGIDYTSRRTGDVKTIPIDDDGDPIPQPT